MCLAERVRNPEGSRSVCSRVSETAQLTRTVNDWAKVVRTLAPVARPAPVDRQEVEEDLRGQEKCIGSKLRCRQSFEQVLRDSWLRVRKQVGITGKQQRPLLWDNFHFMIQQEKALRARQPQLARQSECGQILLGS